MVVIGIIAGLVALLLPVLGKAQESAKSVKCLSNLRQFGVISATYTAQYSGYLFPCNWSSDTNANPPAPNSYNLYQILLPYLPLRTKTGAYGSNILGARDNQIWTCPTGLNMSTDLWRPMNAYACNKSVHVSYEYNGSHLPKFQLQRLTRIRRPTDVISMCDVNQPANVSGVIYGWIDYTESTVSELSAANYAAKATLPCSTVFNGVGWNIPNKEQSVGFFPRYRHNYEKTLNALYVDGHCETMRSPNDMKILNISTNY